MAQPVAPSSPAMDRKESEALRELEARLGPSLEAATVQAASCFPGPLCDRCIGRLFGRLEPRGHPMAKGALLRGKTGLPAAPTEEECGWCEGFFTQTDHFARRAMQALAECEFTTFLIATRMHPDVLACEEQAREILEQAGAGWFEPLKMELNREVGACVHETLGVPVDLGRPDAIAQVDPYFDQVEVTTSSIFLYGRYRKLDRTIPQTRWPCRSCKGTGCGKCDRTGQQYRDSVESLVSHVPVAAFGAEASSFHGAGREDIDALMLGTGRPFVLELKLPRWRTPRRSGTEGPLELRELEGMINDHGGGRAEVLGLRWSEKKEVVQVKNGTPDKAYRAHIAADRPVTIQALRRAVERIAGAHIDQRTPIRVVHRRADKIRRRRVHTVELVSFGRHAESDAAPEAFEPSGGEATLFSLDIKSASGTYIKELVSGDDGRTDPSFAGLVQVPMRVEALDVVAVEDRAPGQ